MLRLIAVLLIVTGLAIDSVAAGGDARVVMQEGLVSAHFEATSVPVALEAVQRATGVEIVVPPSARDKSLTLAVEQVPFEQFVRRVLHQLDLGGFALMYEANGTAQRVLVVDRARGGLAGVGIETPAIEAVPTTEGGSEPVYVPPAMAPVYIPPTSPPVYIPPSSPPVYTPPATEPREVPPSQ